MTVEISPHISADPIFADMESVCASIAEKRPLHPAIARRIQDRAESLRRRLPETNLAVELIREARDDE